MLIGIISDTHDHAKNLLKAIDVFNDKKVELVFHCGDWVAPFMPDFCKDLNCKIISVLGNNEGDAFRFIKSENENRWNIEFYKRIFVKEIDGKKLTVYHGDDPTILSALIKFGEYDAVFSGHTHVTVNEMHGKTLHVNPGTICEYVDSKIIDKPTVAIYNTETNLAEIIDIK
ncbi:MAG: metallophosphoesterase [bacterium]